MTNYYKIVEGNLRTGDIAKSSDINHIQLHVQDMAREMMMDLHDGESFLLGSGEAHKNDFVLTPAPKFAGRYIDDRLVPDESGIDKQNYININRYEVRQPITLTQTSLYSVIIWMKNDSNRDIRVNFRLESIDGDTLKRTNSLIIPARTTEPKEFEVIFDVPYYPTAPNLTHQKLMEDMDGQDIPIRNNDEESYDEGFDHTYEDEKTPMQFTAGVSQLYFIIEKTDLNEAILDPQSKTPSGFNPDTSLGVFFTKRSNNADKKVYCSITSGTVYEETDYNIFFKEVFANKTTYLCQGGQAVIGGEKVLCVDSHVSVDGGNSFGNVLSHIYLDSEGHLRSRNSQANLTEDIDAFIEDLNDRKPAVFFSVGLILTYANFLNKEPLIIQSQEYDQIPLSHHERLRRLEKQVDWVNDIAIPSRFKFTLTGEDLLDTSGATLAGYPFGTDINGGDKENVKSYYVTTDSKGNPTIRLSSAETTSIDITLKEDTKDKDGNNISLEENDIRNASYFSKTTQMVHDNKKGTLSLGKKDIKNPGQGVGKTDEEAKKTEYNPWDDFEGNRPADEKIKKNERAFTVTKGKNGGSDKKSEFPGMTFYTDSNYKLLKLNIPIHKFKNCSGIKFFIWERQSKNNKKNTVWLKQKIWTSDVFSLKKAKVKGDYQYMDSGFTLDFGKKGLTLKKAQYVIIGLPIPKSGEGTCYVETYKPKNPKDFLITYHGAANASKFTLKSRVSEIWYNSAVASVVEEEYHKKGSVESKVITWSDEGLQKIDTIIPKVGKNLNIPDKCSVKIWADTGGGWKELKKDEPNQMTGGAKTFQWKMEFQGDGKSTPTLSYDETNKYAIQFTLQRAPAVGGNLKDVTDKDKNMCLTTKVFDADDILRGYIGDPNLSLTNTRFNQYEFARIWADPIENKKLLIDIQGSDRDYTFGESTYPLWTLHYCDLTLDDFAKINVDYSHYEEELEYDENNLRLKLDSAHSYNDNDISISALKEFKKVSNSIDSSTNSTKMTFINKDKITENQIFLKSTFENPKDLTKYTGLTFKFRVKGSNGSKVSGLGLYISSSTESSPTTKTSFDTVDLQDTAVLIPVIDPDTDPTSYYDGKVIKLTHNITDADGNKVKSEDEFYQYIPSYDDVKGKIVYVLQQLHDVKEYKLYRLRDVEYDESKAISESSSENSEKYIEFVARIEIDQNSQNLKYAKEIGLFSYNEDNTYSVSSTNGGVSLELVEVRGLSEDYYPIFNPEKDIGICKAASSHVKVFDYNKITIDGTYYSKSLNSTNTMTAEMAKMNFTLPYTEQIAIKHQSLEANKETQLCYINNPYDGGLSDYKHLGIQIAADVYIPKDCIRIELCKSADGKDPFVSVNLPTLNTVYNPVGTSTFQAIINLSQVFKKINSDEPIKSINFVATDHCATFLKDIVKTADKGDYINLFIGKIVVYKAETIPMFHKKMRYKLYSSTNGKIDHEADAISNETINIRKVGVVIDYS